LAEVHVNTLRRAAELAGGAQQLALLLKVTPSHRASASHETLVERLPPHLQHRGCAPWAEDAGTRSPPLRLSLGAEWRRQKHWGTAVTQEAAARRPGGALQ
jgi:hypothetical protein